MLKIVQMKKMLHQDLTEVSSLIRSLLELAGESSSLKVEILT